MQELEEAFLAAFHLSGDETSTNVTEGDQTLTFAPQQLVAIGDRWALVSTGTVQDGSDADSGVVRVDYLQRKGDEYVPIGSWPKLADGGRYGQPPDWRVRFDLFGGPALQVETTGTVMGCTNDEASLYEFTNTGPEDRGQNITVDYEAEMGGDKSNDVEGKITPGVRGTSFRVIYTRPKGLVVTMSRVGSGYRPTAGHLPETEC